MIPMPHLQKRRDDSKNKENEESPFIFKELGLKIKVKSKMLIAHNYTENY